MDTPDFQFIFEQVTTIYKRQFLYVSLVLCPSMVFLHVSGETKEVKMCWFQNICLTFL